MDVRPGRRLGRGLRLGLVEHTQLARTAVLRPFGLGDVAQVGVQLAPAAQLLRRAILGAALILEVELTAGAPERRCAALLLAQQIVEREPLRLTGASARNVDRGDVERLIAGALGRRLRRGAALGEAGRPERLRLLIAEPRVAALDALLLREQIGERLLIAAVDVRDVGCVVLIQLGLLTADVLAPQRPVGRRAGAGAGQVTEQIGEAALGRASLLLESWIERPLRRGLEGDRLVLLGLRRGGAVLRALRAGMDPAPAVAPAIELLRRATSDHAGWLRSVQSCCRAQ